MQLFTVPFILLSFSTLFDLFLVFYILRKKSTQKSTKQIRTTFLFLLTCVLIICIGVLVENIVYQLFSIETIFFEYFIYVGTCFSPVAFFFTALTYKNTRIKFEKKYLLLFVIPILTLIILWTNDFHHLFYEHYSINMNEATYGFYFYIHSIYTYVLLFVSMFIFIQNSLKNTGVFSMQSILIIIGSIIPIVINLLGTAKIFNMTVYATPISFSLTMIFYYFAIFRFDFLDISPIALRRIVDVMSDSYLVTDTQENIVDYNTTLISTFNIKNTNIIKTRLFDFISINKNSNKFQDAYYKCINKKVATSVDFHDTNTDKYFHIEISPLFNKNMFIGVLILFKDVTEHINDVKQLKDSQNTLMERERLASLGQLIGGIAHNLKTPIMSISGAAEGLSDLVKEYDSSIDDPSVNSQDHHDIAKDMFSWVDKIRHYTEYMSDIITAVKGQAVTLSEMENVSFDLEELVKRVDILMRHELKNALVYLNVKFEVDKNTTLHGDINSLVQVINNMISNSIQSYDGKPEQNIDLIIHEENNNIVISVKDYGPGLPEKVKEKLFSEMITTKGKNGTGLGLYMSYSTIKANFGGDITFESEDGVGTTFNIILPEK